MAIFSKNDRENPKDVPEVLFFGKYNCDYSQKIFQHLKLLGFNVQSVFSKNRSEFLPEEIKDWS